MLSSGQRIPHASIKEQCKEAYFYGKDLVVENTFMAEETVVGRILGDLAPERLSSMSAEALQKLTLFAYHQRLRTLGSAEAINAKIDSIAKPMLRTSLKLNHGVEKSTADLDFMRVRLKRAQDLSLRNADVMALMLEGLRAKFLTTHRTPGFAISDHPVVLQNQYAEHHRDFQHCLGITGLAAKGLQMFFPLSPSVTLAVFDPGVYEYGGSSLVCRAGPADVAWLNQMQAVNALKCMYFDPARMPDPTLDELIRVRQQHGPVHSRNKRLESDIHQQASGTWNQIVAVTDGDVRLGAKLSLIRLLDERRYPGFDRPHAPVRSQELLDLVNRRTQEAEERRKGDAKAAETEVVFTR